MDYNEHERTYEGFIKFSIVGTLCVIGVVICLAMFGFGGTAGTVLGSIMLILNLVAAGIGLASKKSASKIPSIVLGLTAVAALFTVV
ncbi:aa3-type cytochrome c oxidase subunit IV [Rhodobacteraceae bacterium RKSG542]|nr:aa3-type cytochrome c oxidase subunit IV [Pseudovibrio flavus]